ncbi:MAG TPA: malate synthase A [Thermoplasmata archaeon]|nr:malate synthase A [Thermoplasmata archaeon]
MNPALPWIDAGIPDRGAEPARTRASPLLRGVSVASTPADQLEALRPALVELVAELEREFGPRRVELLRARERFRSSVASSRLPDFLEESRALRREDWTVAAAPSDLRDRRVEITGPPERKMVVHALNSGASVYMADFEDAHSPVWNRTLEGQANLRDAVRRRIEAEGPGGRVYRLNPTVATLMVRPRGWHLVEAHVGVDDRPVSASLFDVGVFAYQNAHELLRRGTAPYLYLPKIEHRSEARLWNEVLGRIEDRLGIPAASIRVTVLIETLPAAFEMEEILWELRERVVGLNCGRWDYIFSFIKHFREDPRFVLPDRSQLTMDTGFLEPYSRLLVATCHRRGAHAMGGMAAEIPVRADPEANGAAFERVTQDKEREVGIGYDGTWVAHPDLVPVARAVFNRAMPAPNQVETAHPDGNVARGDLLRLPTGTVSEAGVRTNVRASLRYLDGWLRGSGAVAIDHRMEDAATMEISRSQLWQWFRHGAPVSDRGPFDARMLTRHLLAERAALAMELSARRVPTRTVALAAQLLDSLVTSSRFVEFATIPAYSLLRSETD